MGEPAIIAEEHAFDRRDVEVDGVRLAVVDDGPRDAAETLLFLHGNPMWSFLWRKPMRLAHREGYRVVAPDHAGFGRSDKPADGAYHTLERHIDNTERIVKELDLHGVTLVMHDWGGPIGMGLATRHPDRVRRLVITNTSAWAPKDERAFTSFHKAFSSTPAHWATVNLNALPVLATLFGVRKVMPADVLRAYLWPFSDRNARLAAAEFVRMVPDGPDHPTAATLREMEASYPKLQGLPIQVLWADGDPVLGPKLAAKWGSTFPDAEVIHASKKAKHFWQEDDPDAFIGPLLDFVARTG